jgi:hypothetical protein
MPGRKLPPSRRLAGMRQLWRLNQLGRLAVVDKAEPLDALSARNLIVAELERIDRGRFPRPGETFVLDEPLDGAGPEGEKTA